MKRLVVIIKPFRLDAVVEAIAPLADIPLLIEEVRGYGRQEGHLEPYSGGEYSIAFVPKVCLEMHVADDRVDAPIEAIRPAGRTGRVGDGKVFVIGGASVSGVAAGVAG